MRCGEWQVGSPSDTGKRLVAVPLIKSVEYGQRLQQLKIEIEELAGRPLNIDSPNTMRPMPTP